MSVKQLPQSRTERGMIMLMQIEVIEIIMARY